MKGTPEYSTFTSMHTRCYNKNSSAYKNYGGRGILVCKKWYRNFRSFIADMGLRPSMEHSIDRRNNNEGYSPDNCYWATPTQQNRNVRKNSKNISGCRGVGWRKDRHKWRVTLGLGGRQIQLGDHVQWWDAVCARKSAENRYWL